MKLENGTQQQSEKTIPCKQCGGTMHMESKRDTSAGSQIGALALAIIGFPVMLILPPLGFAVGLAMIVGAAVLNFRKRSRWKCGSCGYGFEVEK